MAADLRLDQVVLLRVDVLEEGADVDGVLRSQLLQHAVQEDVDAGASRPAAVDTNSQPRATCPGGKGPCYLQWTTTGPVACVLAPEDLRMKLSSGRAESGTPTAGHRVYWKCVSVRSGLRPF